MKKHFILGLLFVASLSVHAQPKFWQKVPGKATDIAVGPEGSVWVIGNDSQKGGSSIYKFEPATRTWSRVAGSGYRISVDSEGNAWVVNVDGNLYRFGGGKWERFSCKAQDVSVGADYSVLIIEASKPATNGKISRWNRQAFEPIDGAATNIAVAKDGTPWVVTMDSNAYRRVQDKWVKVGSGITDLGVGGDGSVYAVTAAGHVLAWNGKGWDKVDESSAIRVAVDPKGNPWIIDSKFDIYFPEPSYRR